MRLVLACAMMVLGPDMARATQGPPATEITGDEIAAYVAVLAQDSMRGRSAPSRELNAAAAFVAGELRTMGLQPGAGDTTYTQVFSYELRQLDVDAISLTVPGRANVDAVYGRDYAALYGSVEGGEGRLHVVSGGDVEALEPSQVRGRVLLVVLPEAQLAAWPTMRLAALRVARRGSAAALILGMEGPGADVASRRQRYEAPLRFRDEGDLVPTIYAGPRLLAQLLEIGEREPMVTVTVPWRVRDPGRIPNVVARLPGSDDAEPKRVLLVAHLDHIGVDESAQGDVVFNGADDNGSGVAALLEIAEELARRPRVKRPRYAVEFLFTGGEEAGLLGARAYLRIGAADTGSVAAVLNLDMVSRNGDDLYVLDGPHARLGDLVRSVLASRPDLSLALRDAPDESELFRRSDHFAFSEAGIPAVWLFTGFHADYHAVTDEVSRIDAHKAARVARLVLAVIDSL